MPDDTGAHKIPYEFAQEFADAFADLGALYHMIDILEKKIWGLVKWSRHSLSDSEYEVIRLRYAPSNKEGRLTLEEIGNLRGMTKERVRQIEAKALSKLGVELYKTTIIYERGGEDDGSGKHAAFGVRKLKPLAQ